MTAWIRVNEPDEDLIYKNGLGDQVCFIRDDIQFGLFYNLENPDINGIYDSDRCEQSWPTVIGTHHSKSVLLPVMEITLKTVGVKMIFRYNFYDRCVSIESEQNINCNFKGLITDEVGYFEGFPKNRIYKRYSDRNKKKFSFCIANKYKLYNLLYLLRDYFYNNNLKSQIDSKIKKSDLI